VARALLLVLASQKEAAMLVQDLMTRDPLTVPLETPVSDARRMMVERRIRHLLVTDGRRLAGIVTDRDIRLSLPSPATSLSVWEINYLVARLSVESVMTRSVITVDPRRDAFAAARIMLEHKIGALPVLDAGTIVGIVTETDILRAFAAMPETETAGAH
jgi:acetoin utilization protein AcuB